MRIVIELADGTRSLVHFDKPYMYNDEDPEKVRSDYVKKFSAVNKGVKIVSITSTIVAEYVEKGNI
jgi:hypothetical protein